jgi:hypothetical protein
MEALSEPEASVIPDEISKPSSSGDAPNSSHPQFIPVYKEPEGEASSYEVIPTAAPPIGDLEIPREPALQETANETTRTTVADRVEPGLLSPQDKYLADEKEPSASWSTSSSAVAATEPASAAAVEVAPAEPELTQLPAIRATGEVSDIDFEARVAAAMAAYSHATEAAPAAEVSETSTSGAAGVPEEAHAYAAQPVETAPVTEAAPSFEYQPPVRASEAAENAPAADHASVEPEIAASQIPADQVVANPTLADQALADQPLANPVPAAPAQEAVPEPAVIHEVVTAGVEAAAIAAATETGADHHHITQAVHRVMERLKPELVEEIMRELRNKK